MTVEGARFRQGAGRLCLDYIRTLRYRGTPYEEELLLDAESLTAWVRQCGLCGDLPEAAEAGADAVAGRALREAVYTLVTAAAAGEPLPRAARNRVNEAARTPVPIPETDASATLRWRADDPVPATLSLIARDTLDLVTSDAATRVRPCADEACGALFLDTSRPGTRRWCSMGTCGNRAKKVTLRQKAEQR